ncbi:MAG: hypothetical protein JETT_2055 [Candidatus Jettenia ecosi]|uniref:Uncharacterized protein n=1 Tax=Candidatus Jettenia ecosi TaxID=2494326 RepID=A0A533QAG7_9BACT|nr:MAG: hypothetical protein JETT_2055 [Candidatus Jettenia ecosi]
MDTCKDETPFANTKETLSCISKIKGIGIKEYREFVEAGIKRENNSFEEVESDIIPGSEKFKTTTKKANERSGEIGRYFRINGSTVSKALKRVEIKYKEWNLFWDFLPRDGQSYRLLKTIQR